MDFNALHQRAQELLDAARVQAEQLYVAAEPAALRFYSAAENATAPLLARAGLEAVPFSTVFLSALALVATLALWSLACCLRLRSSRRRAALLLGAPGAGKTTLFCVLRDGRPAGSPVPECHTSMAENEALVRLGSRRMHVVDCPGHERVRAGWLRHARSARCVVFAVSALQLGDAEARQAADFLNDVLTNEDLARARTSVLVACNKSEAAGALRAPEVRAALEREIGRVRAAAEPKGTAAKFSFDDERCRVSFAECSVANNEIEPVVEFLLAH
eukprot:m51a1_g3275 putative signal recognition particle receptor subunit beta (274) ;mRNA; f:237678-238499